MSVELVPFIVSWWEDSEEVGEIWWEGPSQGGNISQRSEVHLCEVKKWPLKRRYLKDNNEMA
jgi:hypothetical protein